MANNPAGVRALALTVLSRKWDKPWDTNGTEGENLSRGQKPAGTMKVESTQGLNPLVPLSQGLGRGHWDKRQKLGQSLGQVWDKPSAFPFSEALAELEERCPAYVVPERWSLCINDAERFLADWGDKAVAFGWTVDELSGLHEPPARPHPSYCRLSRYDCTGLVWNLLSRRVVALTGATVAIQSRTTGNILIYRKYNKPAFGPLGDSLDDFIAF
jgi:hypothetical protein